MMEREIRKRIANPGGSGDQFTDDDVTAESLQSEGLMQMVPRDYQVQGIRWLLQCHSNGHGCILGDDMGLGKTLQSIAFLLHLHVKRKERKVKGPFLVLSPLSVATYWEDEFKRLAPTLRVLRYGGPKEHREQLRRKISCQVEILNRNMGFACLTVSSNIFDFTY
jgi:SNF2 family DNA or RNA helicase